MKKPTAEPHKIKTIKNLDITTYQDRNVVLREARYNTFNIRSDKVTYEMLSQGTGAKSQDQSSGILIGDEAYAGSRNFENLVLSVSSVFGQVMVCPTHNILGSLKIINSTLMTSEKVIIANNGQFKNLVDENGGDLHIASETREELFSGNFDLEELNSHLSTRTVAFIYADLYADGYRPLSVKNLQKISELARKYRVLLILNASQAVEWATFVREFDKYCVESEIAPIIYKYCRGADVVVLDAGQDPRCVTGGMLSTNDQAIFEKFMNEVVIFEGLHTYGGMAGRTMESFARGIIEMTYEPQAEWIFHQVDLLAESLRGLPLYRGGDGVYLKADEFLPHIADHQASALAALLYLKAGIRCITEGRFENKTVLPVQIPRLRLTNDQVLSIGTAIRNVYGERDKLKVFELLNQPEWMDEAEFIWNHPCLDGFSYRCEAYRISTFEYVGITSREEREKHIEEAGYNTFLLPSSKVFIDLLTDSGTCAQTTLQWSKYNEAEETPASSRDFFDMEEILKDVTGYKYIIPTHQGRAAEHIMSQALIKGGFVPGNMYFTTTKLHQELAGGTFADVICDEAHDPLSEFPWKGNIDIAKISKILDEHGDDSIPYISFELSVNLAGGQPVQMKNAREVYQFCQEKGIPVMFDATRAVENAYMIRKNDPDYGHVSIKDILRELFSYGDGCTVSSKKDYLVNIGGFLAIREDESFYKRALSLLRIYEGSRTTGGMSAGDMAMHAEGVEEMLDYNYIQARVEQTHYLGERLNVAGIPVVEPIGTHAVFLDAKRFLPHIDQDLYPAQALAAALYVESGIRAMERGNVSSGRDKETGKNHRPSLELVRLTIPRRVYTNAHMDLVADSIIDLYGRKEEIQGLEFVYEPENLRFFQGRFRKIGKGLTG